MSDSIYAYLDTNILLEFRPPRDIPWSELLGTSRVTLVIATVVLQELQDAKDGGKLPAAKRRRASERLKWLETTLMSDGMIAGSETQIQPGVRLVYDGAAAPEAIYSLHHLDRTINDDRIVAGAIAAHERGQQVCVVSDDLGARLQAARCGLRAVAPPEEGRCAAEIDPQEQELRNLKRQLAEYEVRRPKLGLVLPNAASYLERTVCKPLPLTEDQIRHRIARIRATMALNARGAPMIGKPSERGRRRYEAELERYLEAIAPLLPSMIEFHNASDLHVELADVELINDGTVPAEGVEVHLWAPEFVRWSHDGPPQPDLPKMPEIPKSAFEEMVTGGDLDRLSRLSQFAVAERRRLVGYETFDTKPSFQIEEQKARSGCGKLKHAHTRALPRILAAFASYEQVQSFAIRYEIHADNLPKPQGGEIHVRVSKEDRCRETEELGYEECIVASRWL